MTILEGQWPEITAHRMLTFLPALQKNTDVLFSPPKHSLIIPPALMLTSLFDPTTFLKIHLSVALDK
jgi:hypothetical protein